MSQSQLCTMCGACADAPMTSLLPDDVVKHTPHTGASSRIGRIEEMNRDWGVAVVWETGERSWFPYDSWCPLREDTGWRMVLTMEPFTPSADFALAPPKVGRGLLLRPPATLKRPRKTDAREEAALRRECKEADCTETVTCAPTGPKPAAALAAAIADAAEPAAVATADEPPAAEPAAAAVPAWLAAARAAAAAFEQRRAEIEEAGGFERVD